MNQEDGCNTINTGLENESRPVKIEAVLTGTGAHYDNPPEMQIVVKEESMEYVKPDSKRRKVF